MKKIFLNVLSLTIFASSYVLAGLDEELLETVKNNNYCRAEELLKCGANPNKATNSAEFHVAGSWFARTDGKIDATALALAILKYNSNMVKLLVQHGANIQQPLKFTGTSTYDQGDEEKLYSLTPREIFARLNFDESNRKEYIKIHKLMTQEIQHCK